MSESQQQVHRQIASVDSIDSLRQLIRQTESILIVGSRTKPSLSSVDAEIQLVSTRPLTGIIQYEPSEFTFTARAGTTLQEIRAALAEKNQYLPFDPLLVRQDATIGGTLAAGISGPGRHRFGGVRDFVLGAQFVAGDGQLIESGGKVVKNAAGFDIPKLLVGSCGRLAAITALTFKVFPKPIEFHTHRISCDDHAQASDLVASLARGRWELDAIDYRAETRSIWIRIGGSESACDAIAKDIAKVLGDREVVAIDAELAIQGWQQLGDLSFGGTSRDGAVKVPFTLQQMRRLAAWCDDHRDAVCLHASVAGSIGWLAVGDGFLGRVDAWLKESQMNGLVLRGAIDPGGSCVIGDHRSGPIESAIKNAMDPPGRFPSFQG